MLKKQPQQTTETRTNMRGGSGEILIRHFFKENEFKARCRFCSHLTIPTGAGIGLHEHSQEDEIFLILSGTGTMTDNGKDVTIGAGDAILTGNGASHSIKNTGTEPLTLIAVIMTY